MDVELDMETSSKCAERELQVEGDDGGGEDASLEGATMTREDELRAMLAHQLELEIALRKRVAKVVEARIQWAERLKALLTRGSGETPADPTRFKEQALEEFRAVHAPLNLDSHAVHPRGSFIYSLPDTLSQTPDSAHASSSTSKQLYLIPPTPEPTPFPPLLLLTCPHPSCPTPHPSTTLQGLLNHARITHGPSYTFASHDEFIASPGATSVLDAKLEPERYARVLNEGVRVSASGVRGLRALFEGAFGGGEGNMGLGLSADAPALAGLLGRKTRKGEIRAFGQDEEVDVERVDGDEVGKERWRGYGVWAPKRKGKSEVDTSIHEAEHTVTPVKDKDSLSTPAHVQNGDPATKPSIEHTQSSSRFHIKKRVIVSDWSQSLRRSQIQPDGPTHRWIIRLTAPSYSDHITTFLSAVRVQCASIPPLFEDTITCSTPPFVISRLSSAPFLARVTLVFADERTKDVTVTQWVDLDPMRSGRPILGAEQIFDVGLDRNAQPLPVDASSDSTSQSALWAEDRGVSDKATQDGTPQPLPLAVEPVQNTIRHEVDATPTFLQEAPQEESLLEDTLNPPHERLIPILSKLRSRLPLTLEDSKGGTVPNVAYMCFPTHSKLLEAPHGRRKAVEWQYARTLFNMLTTEYASYDADLDPMLVESLGVAQLYAYLVAEKVFPRPEPQAPMKLDEEAATVPSAPVVNRAHDPPRYCGVCGLNILSHPLTLYPVDTSGFACPPSDSSRRPICDVGLWTTSRPIRSSIQRINPIYGLITTQGVRESLRGASQLVECASPQMTLAFHALTKLWGLKTFGYSAKRRNPATTLDGLHVAETRFPLELLGIDTSHVDRTLAPHALLALVAEIFMKRLVREALRARAETLGGLAGGIGPALLTTAHISRALMDGRGHEGWLPLMAVARVGLAHVDNV
ncbi:hypothetical protein FRC08_005183 [Ceratobasidium sp. 394]|nr:hypothetical protein FRC08_005183 [Ceratobasidium sp. 394]KAG9093339.1 hypothetical protein FS749_014555 [Ceratobasidium sp. UAMH 11750]